MILWWSVSSIGLQQWRLRPGIGEGLCLVYHISTLRTFKKWKLISTSVWYNKVSIRIGLIVKFYFVFFVCNLLIVFLNLKCEFGVTSSDGSRNGGSYLHSVWWWLQWRTSLRGAVDQDYWFGKVRKFSYLNKNLYSAHNTLGIGAKELFD